MAVCKRCKSENINYQVINEVHYKKGHGCILTLLFGILYLTLWFFKWITKYMIFISYKIFKWTIKMPIKYLLSLITKKPVSKEDPQWLKKMMRKKGKSYNETKSIAVCQSCGYQWEIKH